MIGVNEAIQVWEPSWLKQRNGVYVAVGSGNEYLEATPRASVVHLK